MIGIAEAVPWALTQEILDEEGHYIILKGKVNMCNVVIIGVYAPNRMQTSFGRVWVKELREDAQFEIFMLCDFNAVLNKMFDRSADSSTPDLPKSFFQWWISFN